jgi:hypothetical protein
MTETAAKTRRTPVKPKEDVEPKTVLIHFVAEGFTAFGTIWRPGQELEIIEGTSEYEVTLDIEGHSWLNVSEEEQVSRWGEVKFKLGPTDIPNVIIEAQPFSAEKEYKWNTRPGKTTSNAYTSAQNVENAANAEIRRGRSVPTVNHR